MKNYINYLLAATMLILSSGCEDDIVDLKERDRLPTELAVANISGLEASVLQVYQTIRSIHESNEISLYKQCGTDIVRGGTHLLDTNDGGMEGMMIYSPALSPTSGVGDQGGVEDIFNALYLAIDRCNVVIQFADNFDAPSPEQETRKNIAKGEAYALRAYCYLEMVQRWDNVVLYTRLLEPGEPINFDVELSSPSEIYNQVIEDCMGAIELLPTRANLGNAATKASKGLAYHLLSKAYMDTEQWGLAAEAADAVINDGSYSLQPLDGIFGLQGGKTGEENNEELILSWAFSPNITNRPQRTVQMYVPLYRLADGLTTSLDQGGRPWSRLSPSDYYWTLFDSDNDGDLDDEEDGRINEWHKRVWTYNDEPNLPDGKNLGDPVTYADLVAQFGAGAGRELRYLDPTTNKFFEDGTYGRETNDAEGFRNVIVYRLSEAYLISAEAHWRNSNLGVALLRINRIRERAFGDSDHNFTTLDQEIFVEEHARELGHEGHRWAFLKRLGLLVERTNLYCRGVDDEMINMQPHHVRWPIPQPFVDLTGVQQNPDY